jgi:hypothetical protein
MLYKQGISVKVDQNGHGLSAWSRRDMNQLKRVGRAWFSDLSLGEAEKFFPTSYAFRLLIAIRIVRLQNVVVIQVSGVSV